MVVWIIQRLKGLNFIREMDTTIFLHQQVVLSVAGKWFTVLKIFMDLMKNV